MSGSVLQFGARPAKTTARVRALLTRAQEEQVVEAELRERAAAARQRSTSAIRDASAALEGDGQREVKARSAAGARSRRS